MSRRYQAVRIDEDDLAREPLFWAFVLIAFGAGLALMPIVGGAIWLVCWIGGVVR